MEPFISFDFQTIKITSNDQKSQEVYVLVWSYFIIVSEIVLFLHMSNTGLWTYVVLACHCFQLFKRGYVGKRYNEQTKSDGIVTSSMCFGR